MKDSYDFRAERREGTRWWAWGLGLLVVTIAVLALLNYAGIIGRTVVERKVFESSYQRTESMKAREALFEAQISQLEARLNNPNLTHSERNDIESSLATLRVQLETTRRMK